MSRKQRTSEHGFSLAETIIALAILAGTLLSLAQLFTTATGIVTTARHVTTGSILASQKLEELRSVVSGLPSVPTIDGGIEYVDRVGAAVQSGGGISTNVAYTRQWRVRPLASDPDRVALIRVVVTPGTVASPLSDSRPRRIGEVVLVTLQASNGP